MYTLPIIQKWNCIFYSWSYLAFNSPSLLDKEVGGWGVWTCPLTVNYSQSVQGFKSPFEVFVWFKSQSETRLSASSASCFLLRNDSSFEESSMPPAEAPAEGRLVFQPGSSLLCGSWVSSTEAQGSLQPPGVLLAPSTDVCHTGTHCHLL